MPKETFHLLSFDVEEYFQIEAASTRITPADWPTWKKRLSPCIDRILELLDRYKASATFFVLGWIARHEPDLIRRIIAAGHEIASHGMTHRMINRMTPQEFRAELTESRKILEDLSGQSIRGFRAPTFSITRQSAWALDILAETGFSYDSSIFPIRHDRYGIPDAPRFAYLASGPGGGTILEIPPLTFRALGINWPVGGGGYLRLLPARAAVLGLKQARRQGHVAMLYLHPWELDADQPTLPLSGLAQWRHRVGLKHTGKKLDFLLKRFKFTSVQSVLPRLSEGRTKFRINEG
ncbi:MAG: XrtA system polysaccharide deacetylase [Phycisphaerae bacterium]